MSAFLAFIIIIVLLLVAGWRAALAGLLVYIALFHDLVLAIGLALLWLIIEGCTRAWPRNR
jgi:hypothetical protein